MSVVPSRPGTFSRCAVGRRRVVSCRRMARRSWCFAAVLSVGLSMAGSALGQTSVTELANRLRSAEDFRVRTQAALALGSTKSGDAVDPLCSALADENTTVRAAAAAALGKLKKGGADCLKKRLDEESSSSVKSVIKKSIEALESAGDPTEDLGSLDASSRYYIALDDVSDKTDRGIGAAVRRLLITELRGERGLVVAPTKEKPADGKALLAKHKGAVGLLLLPKVKKPKYENGSLTVQFQLTVFTYPDRAMKGMIPVKFTQDGTSSTDTKAEDELIDMGIKSAVSKFLKNIGKFQ